MRLLAYGYHLSPLSTFSLGQNRPVNTSSFDLSAPLCPIRANAFQGGRYPVYAQPLLEQ